MVLALPVGLFGDGSSAAGRSSSVVFSCGADSCCAVYESSMESELSDDTSENRFRSRMRRAIVVVKNSRKSSSDDSLSGGELMLSGGAMLVLLKLDKLMFKKPQ